MERLRFGWVFPTEADFGDFDPLTLEFNTLDIQKAHPFVKLSLLSYSISQSVANYGLYPDQ